MQTSQYKIVVENKVDINIIFSLTIQNQLYTILK